MDCGQKMSKGITRYSFIDGTRHKCRILSDDVIFLSVIGVIIVITEDDVILSITEDSVILSITEDDGSKF